MSACKETAEALATVGIMFAVMFGLVGCFWAVAWSQKNNDQ